MNRTDPSRQTEVESVLGLDQTARVQVRLKRWLLPIAGVLIILAIIVIARSYEGEQPLNYQTQKARQGDLIVTVTATGNLEPTNNVNVGSELSGIVKSVEVEENEWVKAGQVLARLDTEKLTAAVRKSRAALEAAQAKVLDAQATIREKTQAFERFKKAYAISGGKIPSQDDLDTAEAALVRARADEASSKAAVTEAQAALDSDLTDLKKAVIVSPINGIVLTRDVEVGQTVAASLQAVTLFNLAQDLTRMELNVSVDEADVGRIKPGQTATFTVDAYPDRSFNAKITRVSYGSTTTDGVVTYATVLAVDNTDLSLRPGMTATAVITVQRVENALLVPNAALRFSPEAGDTDIGNQKSSVISKIMPRPPRHKSSAKLVVTNNGAADQKVWVLKDGRPIAVAVRTGATNGVMTEIIKGAVTPGMELIVASAGASQ